MFSTYIYYYFLLVSYYYLLCFYYYLEIRIFTIYLLLFTKTKELVFCWYWVIPYIIISDLEIYQFYSFTSVLYLFVLYILLLLYKTPNVIFIYRNATTTTTFAVFTTNRNMRKHETNKLSLLSLIINSIIIFINHCKLATFQ